MLKAYIAKLKFTGYLSGITFEVYPVNLQIRKYRLKSFPGKENNSNFPTKLGLFL